MSDNLEVSIFESQLGWFALVGSRGQVSWCSIGYSNRAAANRSVRERFGSTVIERDWHPDARQRLTAFAAGEKVSFDSLALDLDGVPAFHRRVLDACRKIGYGRTISYAQLARAAGRPRAVRAAGSAMARNPVPIIVPCHRVISSDGGLGGYSARQGVSLKARLLALEARATTQPSTAARLPRRVRRPRAIRTA
jgi:methylated-DNA-[protein]-cysteine S-methyltransferase